MTINPRRLLTRPGAPPTWKLWAQPPAAVTYVLTVVLVAAMCAVWSGLGTAFTWPDLQRWTLLAVAGVLCIELTRSSGEATGVYRDLLSAWQLPGMLLLPPVFALLTPVPLWTYKQVRVRPLVLHRRIFSIAAIGSANFAGSWLFHRLVPDPLTPAGWIVTDPPVALAAAVLCGALACTLNVLVVAAAVRVSTIGSRWRSLLWDREAVRFDVCETCIGILIAMATAVSPLAVLLALPPVLLLHRSLTHAQLRAAARTDAKTGLLNAGTWQEEATREIRRAARANSPLAVLVADLDNFKRVNDTYGHLVGDRLLVAAAQALHDGLRPYDVLGRFGGEEFTVVLPGADHAEAARIAERLRRHVAAVLLPVDDDRTVQVTISIGGAIMTRAGEDLTDLLAAADHALYIAKNAGRDRVSLSSR